MFRTIIILLMSFIVTTFLSIEILQEVIPAMFAAGINYIWIWVFVYSFLIFISFMLLCVGKGFVQQMKFNELNIPHNVKEKEKK